MKKLIPSIVLLHLVLLALFTVLVIAVHLIPREAIEPQFKTSVKIFTAEGVYPDKMSLDGSVLVDNFTDCYMLNVAYCADASHPVDAAMRNYRYRDDANMVVFLRDADGAERAYLGAETAAGTARTVIYDGPAVFEGYSRAGGAHAQPASHTLV